MNLFRTTFTIILIAFYSSLFCQINNSEQGLRLLKYDYETETLDTLPYISYDTSLTKSNTSFFIGQYNDQVAELDINTPTENLYDAEGSVFTKKIVADQDYDISSYPFRTISPIRSLVRVVSSIDGVRWDTNTTCSGVLVSKRHFLTSAHCISNYQTGEPKGGSITLCPGFTNGVENSIFGCYSVKKAYYFEDYSLPCSDLALLELDEDIGTTVGWVGIGFDENQESFEDGVFYKMSYPAKTELLIDPNTYNGDTMYYSYGHINKGSCSITADFASAIPGESGSSIIKTKNNEEYMTYGTLAFSYNITHSLITEDEFYQLKDIIKDDVLTNILPSGSSNEPISIFPNPTNELIAVEIPIAYKAKEFTITNSVGQSFYSSTLDDLNESFEVDVTNFPDGVYYLNIFSNNETFTGTFIKQ